MPSRDCSAAWAPRGRPSPSCGEHRMKRILWGAGVLGLLLGASVALSQDKNPTVKEIMTRAHKGSGSVLTLLGRELKAEEPNWSDVQKQTKELLTLGGSLGKNEPPKGSTESWQRL